jgi:hypothetical protein
LDAEKIKKRIACYEVNQPCAQWEYEKGGKTQEPRGCYEFAEFDDQR